MGTLPNEQVALLTDYDTSSSYSRAYHTLYNNIHFDWDREQKKNHTILFTTPAPYLGYAAASANVAIAAAQNGTPTILVDADLYKPGLQQRFGVGAHSGLSDLLTENTITAQGIAPYLNKTFITDLSLLGNDTPSKQPLEVGRWLSTRLELVIASLRQHLDTTESRPGLIIFNSSPVLSHIDAALISAQVDQTFLIIASGHTTHNQARQAQEQLQRAHAKLAGIVMLDV